MIVYVEVECMLYDAQSLKEKRSILKSMITKIKNDFNVAIAEIDYANLWQRSKLGIVTVANEYKYAEKIMQQVLNRMDQHTELERTITKMERL